MISFEIGRQMSDVIDSFTGKYFFLSNFFYSPITYLGLVFSTGEHLFQWFKTFDDTEAEKIRLASTPRMAKALGRRCTLRDDWEEKKFIVMDTTIQLKFHHNSGLAKALDNTGDALLIEGNTWGDRIWGMVKRNGEWVGENNLGKILMQQREYNRTL
jgi:ribA/ribD-fused uncharacterized protein